MIEQERDKMHFNDMDVIRNIFIIDTVTGKYRVVFNNVTTNMSIAVGIGTLAYKIEAVGHGSISEGVKAYHTEGDEGYLTLINGYLTDLGCAELR